MNLVCPLTLLVVPLIGSLIIISYPYLSRAAKLPNTQNQFYRQLTVATNSSMSVERMELNNQESSMQALPYLDKVVPLKELVKMSTIKQQDSNLKKIAIITSFINFIISIFLWVQFDSNYIGAQFVSTITSLEFIQFKLGVDGISIFFVLLTTFITPIALLSSHNDIDKNLKFYLISILLLETLQIGVFIVLDLLLFYIFFESVLIPLFFIVGVWGASSAKVRAAFLLFLYTLKNQCKRAKFRGSPKALITKLFKET